MSKQRRRGVQAIKKSIGDALSSDERDEILARLLAGLNAGERKLLIADLPADTAEALASAFSAE